MHGFQPIQLLALASIGACALTAGAAPIANPTAPKVETIATFRIMVESLDSNGWTMNRVRKCMGELPAAQQQRIGFRQTGTTQQQDAELCTSAASLFTLTRTISGNKESTTLLLNGKQVYLEAASPNQGGNRAFTVRQSGTTTAVSALSLNAAKTELVMQGGFVRIRNVDSLLLSVPTKAEKEYSPATVQLMVNRRFRLQYTDGKAATVCAQVSTTSNNIISFPRNLSPSAAAQSCQPQTATVFTLDALTGQLLVGDKQKQPVYLNGKGQLTTANQNKLAKFFIESSKNALQLQVPISSPLTVDTQSGAITTGSNALSAAFQLVYL